VSGFDIVRDGPAVRREIGAALQAVALDNFLTGREHLAFVGQLHGMSRREGAERADELLARVGLTEAADRKVGGYSGGMRRRLDLALALVHNPRVLFLDEPTTGLDPQSRSALWDEVARLSRDDGVTVFLTTQYLEEADVLANRVGIIDHGHIVAEGTPAELKREFGAPTIEAAPMHVEDHDKLAAVLARFGTETLGAPGHVAVRLADSAARVDLVGVVRAIDEAGISVSQLQQYEPSLDDVFLAKTGRKLEGAGEEEAAAGAGESSGEQLHADDKSDEPAVGAAAVAGAMAGAPSDDEAQL
jgi:ABC-2 type transport system ATP-binding protein